MKILRTIFLAWALSSDTPASQKVVYVSYNPPILTSEKSSIYCGKDKTVSDDKDFILDVFSVFLVLIVPHEMFWPM